MNQTETWKPFAIKIAGHSTLTQEEVKKLIYSLLFKRDDFPQFAILDE